MILLTLVLEPPGEGREAPELCPERGHRRHLGVARHHGRPQRGRRGRLRREALKQGPGTHLKLIQGNVNLSSSC